MRDQPCQGLKGPGNGFSFVRFHCAPSGGVFVSLLFTTIKTPYQFYVFIEGSNDNVSVRSAKKPVVRSLMGRS